ncbi:hypothetical protein DL764_005703 [Monosporascus ibericus]|uniref:Transcription factor domain-containing protein n=1 Tax=Monosporascus ibericus TaxID=155417 RepID=A0A4Q4T7Y9_9PEZI|nr:hypothetical protein DL764_005703 [Monosporascus ibericus]
MMVLTTLFTRLSPPRPQRRKGSEPPGLAMVAGRQRQMEELRRTVDELKEQLTGVKVIIRESSKDAPYGACEIVQRTEDDSGVHENPGSDAPPGKPAMPLDHTTHPSLLSRWPAIQALTRDLLTAEGIGSIDDFPIRQEQRPVFRVFGQGGMSGTAGRTPGYNDVSKLTSPLLNGEAWGQAGGPSHLPQVASVGQVINADGNPDFDSDIVWDYTRSFKVNILNMHPIIGPEELNEMVQVFLDSVSSWNAQSTAKAGKKRKRPAHKGSPAATQSHSRPWRSITNAVVLLVLALGKICSHKVISGLEYFALATDIIGRLGNFGLQHVHSHILAGLYLGQLGRVVESYNHIFKASKLVQAMMRPYSAQVYFSKQRSKIHSLLYTGKDDSRHAMVKNGIKEIQSELRDSRGKWVPLSLYPDFESLEVSPASNALAVWLRAKYWDLLVILYRPLLRIILERDTSSLPSSMYCGHPPPRDPRATLGLNAGSLNPFPDLSSLINEDASFAIHTLVENAKTFLGIGHNQHTIATNVFSATHAQWGNLLILAACYKDGVLSRFGTPTSALTAEMNILTGVAKDLKFKDNERRTTATHSSESHEQLQPFPYVQQKALTPESSATSPKIISAKYAHQGLYAPAGGITVRLTAQNINDSEPLKTNRLTIRPENNLEIGRPAAWLG